MPFSSPALLSRRNLLIAGTLGVSSLATAATIAPAAAADDDWSQEFMTRAEDRQGFRVDDMDEWQTANARFILAVAAGHDIDRSEERRVGKECRARWAPETETKTHLGQR